MDMEFMLGGVDRFDDGRIRAAETVPETSISVILTLRANARRSAASLVQVLTVLKEVARDPGARCGKR